MDFSQEAEACIQELPAGLLHHLPPDLQSGPHLTVDDLHRMFLEKPRSMGLQQHQLRSFSLRSFGKCSPESNCTFWPHTNSHYVMHQCDDHICFRNDQIRNLQIYTCSRKLSAPILGPDPRFSILEGLSLNSNLRALPRAFHHLFA